MLGAQCFPLVSVFLGILFDTCKVIFGSVFYTGMVSVAHPNYFLWYVTLLPGKFLVTKALQNLDHIPRTEIFCK